MTPTQRTLAWLRAQGYVCGITEHWNQFARIRQDLFGFIDILAINHKQSGVIGVQATASGVSARCHKIEELEIARWWLECGNPIWVVGWRKLGKKQVWTPRCVVAEGGGRLVWRET